jgi:hypothetical protein
VVEELQSTEILDREILEDARKKAHRILKTADETVKASADAWEKRTAEAVADLESKYARRRSVIAGEIMARLPMDKRRAKSEKIEEYLKSGVDNWYGKQSRERILSLLEGNLRKRLIECPEFENTKGAGQALFRNIKKDEAEALLKKLAVSGFTLKEISPLPGKHFPEIVLDIPAVRITASIDMIIDTLLHDKRAELVTALVGDEALNADEGGEEGSHA